LTEKKRKGFDISGRRYNVGGTNTRGGINPVLYDGGVRGVMGRFSFRGGKKESAAALTIGKREQHFLGRKNNISLSSWGALQACPERVSLRDGLTQEGRKHVVSGGKLIQPQLRKNKSPF